MLTSFGSSCTQRVPQVWQKHTQTALRPSSPLRFPQHRKAIPPTSCTLHVQPQFERGAPSPLKPTKTRSLHKAKQGFSTITAVLAVIIVEAIFVRPMNSKKSREAAATVQMTPERERAKDIGEGREERRLVKGDSVGVYENYDSGESGRSAWRAYPWKRGAPRVGHCNAGSTLEHKHHQWREVSSRQCKRQGDGVIGVADVGKWAVCRSWPFFDPGSIEVNADSR